MKPRVDVEFNAGEDFYFPALRVEDDEGTAIDLSDHTLRLQARITVDDDDAILDLTEADGIDLTNDVLSKTDDTPTPCVLNVVVNKTRSASMWTAAFAVLERNDLRVVYDMMGTSLAGEVTFHFKGSMLISKAVTRP